MKRLVTEEEVEAAKERGALLAAGREMRHLIKTPGWQKVYAILTARPTALALKAIDDESELPAYWRGRVHEAQFLLLEIDQLLKTAAALVEEQEAARVTDEEMRKVLGGGEDVLV